MTINNVANFSPGECKSSQSLPSFSLFSSNDLMLLGAVAGLAVSSIRYALWLNSPTGRKWDAQHTWFVTVVGVMLTLAWLALHDPKAALKAFGFFVISGMPIVVRALNLESETLETFVNREIK